MASLITVLCVLASCGSDDKPSRPNPTGSFEPVPTVGAGALGDSFDSLEKLAGWLQQRTGECKDADRSSMDYFPRYFGETIGSLYIPYVADWGQCSIQDYDHLAMILFKPGQMPAFERVWKDAIDSGKIADNPHNVFGNGFAISADDIGKQLGMHYLRCKPVKELNAVKIPADADGCVFSNVSGA